MSKSAASEASYLDTSIGDQIVIDKCNKSEQVCSIEGGIFRHVIGDQIVKIGNYTAVLEVALLLDVTGAQIVCFTVLSVRQVHSYVEAIGLATSPKDKELWLVWMD